MNPTLTAHVLLFKDNKVLLVRHGEAASHITGTYGIPGGRQEPNETLKQTAVREFGEETGLKIQENDLIEFPNNEYTADLQRKGGEIKRFTMHVFLVKEYQSELKSSAETFPEWIDLDKVSTLNLLPNVENAIQAVLKVE
ncbi:MAG TPA: NUDIX domain-containing protein [Patescibacteria group bacterium]|jgi:8-oxo-dGTP diphosphatase|nr:NUDIX domain-containing protein [Patescibacteria group bacterium]